jgi:hypothetical protein
MTTAQDQPIPSSASAPAPVHPSKQRTRRRRLLPDWFCADDVVCEPWEREAALKL